MFPDRYQRPYPTVHLSTLPGARVQGRNLRRLLLDGDPSIACMTHHADPDTVRLDVRLLEDEEIRALAERLKEIYTGA